MLPPEQIKQIKEQLIQQIESNFPDDKKEDAISQIEEMDDEQLVEFLKQNNLIQEGENVGKGKCIFCSIVFGEIPSTKIGENKKAIAILELNPISKGHTLIIPKEHIELPDKMPKEAQKLGEEIAVKLKNAFAPKNVEIKLSNMFGHEIINLIPVYDDETFESPRQKSNPKELAEVKEEIENAEGIKEEVEEKKEVEKPKEKVEINEKNTWLPRRRP